MCRNSSNLVRCCVFLRSSVLIATHHQGTQIIVEDLFYNVPTRKNALKSASEEHNRITEVVTRFAVHNSSVGFCLRKLNDQGTDVRTPPSSTQVENIRTLYSNAVAKDLVQLEIDEPTYKVKGEIQSSSRFLF